MKSFRHDTNERNKSNVILLRMKHGAAGYGVYLMLLERLAAEPQLRSELDYDMLAFDFQVDAKLIRSVVEDFDLFIIDLDTDCFYHQEMTARHTSKARKAKQEKLLDEFINIRTTNASWTEYTSKSNNSSPERVRAIVQTSFRDHILSKYPRIPDSGHLSKLLNAYLADALRPLIQ